MYLNTISVTWRIFLVITASLVGSLSVQAATTYNFRSGPIYVGETQFPGGNRVQTDPGLLSGGLPPPIFIGEPVGASLSFVSPLAPNSITPIHAESGGLSLFKPAQGGLQSYSSAGGDIAPITSDISQYLAGSAGKVSSYHHYSTVDGQLTTDASGNISAWSLTFVLLGGGNDDLFVDRSTNPPTLPFGFPSFHQQGVLSISNPASPSSITFSNVGELNGKPHTGDFTFNGADKAFVDIGSIQYLYYSQQPGTALTIPEPETWAMMLSGLGLLGWQMRRLKNTSA